MILEDIRVNIPKIEITSRQDNTVDVVREVESVTSKSGMNWLPIILIIVGVIALVVIAIVVIIIVKKKKNARKPESPQVAKSVAVINCPKPEIVKHSGHTLHLWGEETGTKVEYIYLIDVDNEERRFRSIIQDFVTIGRQGADITISDDTSLSRIHCKIIKRGNSYSIDDMNSANGTRYDGQLVTMETPIIPGGIITMGRHRMRVEMVEE